MRGVQVVQRRIYFQDSFIISICTLNIYIYIFTGSNQNDQPLRLPPPLLRRLRHPNRLGKRHHHRARTNPLKSTTQFTREHLLTTYHDLESTQQTATPDLPYSDLLSAIHPTLAARLGLNPPTDEESREFGNSVGTWPAFPDTVDALRRLSKHYKLVVLSNVDRASFAKSNAGSLQGVSFDMILTAQDIGSYKPDPRNFEYMLSAVQREFGVGSGQVLQTAQSQFHDHQPARKVGIKSVWIERPGALMGNTRDPIFDWRFETLGVMADAVETQ